MSGNIFAEQMSLRDWFAGQALAGWLAFPSDGQQGSAGVAASEAYKIADAMIAERQKTLDKKGATNG